MKPPAFTPAENKAFAQQLAAFPAQQLATLIAYLLIQERPDRLRLLAQLKALFQ